MDKQFKPNQLQRNMCLTCEQKTMLKKKKIKLVIMADCYNCSKSFKESELVWSDVWCGKVCQECYDEEESEDEESEDEEEDLLECAKCIKKIVRDSEDHDFCHINGDDELICVDCILAKKCDCENCDDEEEEGCVENRYVCSKCDFMTRNDDPDCSKCGATCCMMAKAVPIYRCATCDTELDEEYWKSFAFENSATEPNPVYCCADCEDAEYCVKCNAKKPYEYENDMWTFCEGVYGWYCPNHAPTTNCNHDLCECCNPQYETCERCGEEVAVYMNMSEFGSKHRGMSIAKHDVSGKMLCRSCLNETIIQ